MSRRTDQLSGIIRKIAAVHVVEIPPGVATIVNVTRVTVSPDLHYADIFITAVSGVENAVSELNKRKSVIRHDLSRELASLYTIPSLRFHVDKKSQELSRLDELLDKIKIKEK